MDTPVKKKRKAPFAANAKTIQFLRAAGWTAEKVEHQLPIPGKFVKVDLFGCLDIIAMRADAIGMLGVQATSGGGSNGKSNGLARRRKLIENANAKTFVQAGNLLWLMVWAKDEKGRWMPQIEKIGIEAFAEVQS